MNASVETEVLAMHGESPQTAQARGAERERSYVWNGKFGAVLIEVRDGQVLVNAQVVEPAESDFRSRALGPAPR